MLQKKIDRNEFEVLFISEVFSGPLDRSFISYYVTTNEINFYRIEYQIDSVMIESLKSESKVSDFIIGAIERFHLIRNDSVKSMHVTFEEMNVNWSTWGDRYDVANDYLKKQTRENKINQII